MHLFEMLPLKFRISCKLPHGRDVSDLLAYEWQKGRAYSMLEFTFSKLCTSDLVTWLQYTFGLSLLCISSVDRCFSSFSVDIVRKGSTASSSMPSSIAVVQTDASEPTDVLANIPPRAIAAAIGADGPTRAQVVIVPPLPVATCISEKHVS